MTPAQVRGVVAGVQRDRRKWSVHNSWHGEAFARQKRLKPLDECIGEQRFRATARQRPKDMMNNLRAMARAQKKRAQRKKAEAAKETADG